jgi:hypothetical protein
MLTASAAHADCGLGQRFQLDFGRSPHLLPTLHAVEVLDCGEVDSGREYDYTARGYFKIHGRTVAQLPQIAGHADATRQRLTLTVKRSTRHTIRVAARRAGARRVTLTLVYRLTRTSGDGSSNGKAYGVDSFLTIPQEPSRNPLFAG